MDENRISREPHKEKPSKYQQLHEGGVQLSDEKIDYVITHLTQGIEDTYDYLETPLSERNLGFISSDNLERIGYANEQRAINIPIAYMNKLHVADKPLSELTVSTPEPDKKEIAFPQYLRNAGREETIHHFQKKGHPLLHAQISNSEKYMQGTELDRLLCDYEVEARRMVDEMALRHAEQPIWKDLDTQLQQNYKERYNKPLA